MGIFSGAAGAHVGMGLAQGLQRGQDEIRRQDEEARIQQIEDERIAAWRADRTDASVDRSRRMSREDVTQGRDDTTYQQGQEDRSHMLTRRPIMEERDDKMATYGMRNAAAQATVNENEVTQIPMRNRAMAADVASAGLRNQGAAQQIKINSFNLSKAELDQAHDQAVTNFEKAAKQYQMSGDIGVMESFYSDNVHDGHHVKIEPQKDGSFAIHYFDDVTGKELPQAKRMAKDGNEILQLAYKSVEPVAWQQSYMVGKQQHDSYSQATGEDNTALSFNKNTGAYEPQTDASGRPIKLAPRGAPPMVFGMDGAMGQQPAAQPQPAAPGTPPAGAIELLRSDPTPEAQADFDEYFGNGASAHYLGK